MQALAYDYRPDGQPGTSEPITLRLAAAPELPNQGQAIAKALQYVEYNMPAVSHGAVLVGSDVKFGHWDIATETFTTDTPFNAVEITARRSSDNDNRLDLFFGPILGLGFLDMETSAVASARFRADSKSTGPYHTVIVPRRLSEIRAIVISTTAERSSSER